MIPIHELADRQRQIVAGGSALQVLCVVLLGCCCIGNAFVLSSTSSHRHLREEAGSPAAPVSTGRRVLCSPPAFRLTATPPDVPLPDGCSFSVDVVDGSIPVSSHWHWRNGWEIHYERARSATRRGNEKGENERAAAPLLLLPGFGVGTFHFKRNMRELSKTHDVFALDFLGQGKSWPTRAPSREDGLCYSVDLWTEQVLAFIDEVIGEPAFIAGNSLGGFIAANLAANHPRAVRGLALMNATPFWAFRKPIARNAAERMEKIADDTPPADVSGGSRAGDAISSASEAAEAALMSGGTSPDEEEGSAGRGGDWLGWDGTLPAPEGLFRFGSWYFDRMRDPRTVKSMLGAVYSNADAVGDEVVSQIIAATERGPSNHDYGVGGHEAFTSIVFSPKVAMTFEEMIDRVQVPMALIYGKEDPWVVPLWGHRIKRQRPETLYYELSPSGHSPHHETPNTVNALLADWLKYANTGGFPPLSGDGEVLDMQEETGVRVRATLVPDAKPRGPVEWLDSTVWSIARGGAM